MRKGDRLEVTCSSLDDEGAGMGESGEVRVHILGALPKERVRATVQHLSPHRPDAWATLERVVEPAPERVPTVCPAYGDCGGCVVQHLAYEAQRAWKTARVERELGQLQAPTREPRLPGVAVAPCVASPRPLGYRNRSKLVFGRVAPSGRPTLGAFAPRTHRLVDMAGCRVAAPPLDEVAASLRALLEAHAVEPYDEATAAGLLRYAILRVNHLGEVLATLVTARDWPDGLGERLARALLDERREVVGVAHNLNPSRGNALYGEETRPLAGRATLEDKVGGVFVRLSPTAFFQLNREVAELIYADISTAAALTGTERVVDCYSGVGGVALTLASRAAEVIGIEENPSAVEDANASAHLNHANRVRFLCGDAAARLAELDAADVVVLNPPRRGCDPEVLEATVRLGPRLIAYVSCNPTSLVRDLELLAGRGFVTRSVRPYDMLPQTPHIEALALLTPA